MKEMNYSSQNKREVLFEGCYLGYRFAILNLGTHPTAYIECKFDDCNDYYDKRLVPIKVHGGFTFYGKPTWNEDNMTYYFGWDYAHAGDYYGYMSVYNSGKKWTTEEIYKEVKYVIRQMLFEKIKSNIKGWFMMKISS